MEWNFNHFTGVDWDAKKEKKAIFQIQGENKGWALAVDKEKGSFDYVSAAQASRHDRIQSSRDFDKQLMFADCDHSHPEVRDDMHAWGEWIMKETGIEGFRFDAIKHMDAREICNFGGRS